jgi:NADH:ubiquinone oxidoreductase subunit D
MIKAHDRLKMIHENFRIVYDAQAMIDKGFATNRGRGAEALGDDEGNLEAYIEMVDRVQDALTFLNKNPHLQSAEDTITKLRPKQNEMLRALKAEIHRLLRDGSQCYINRTAGGDFQVGAPSLLPPVGCR